MYKKAILCAIKAVRRSLRANRRPKKANDWAKKATQRVKKAIPGARKANMKVKHAIRQEVLNLFGVIVKIRGLSKLLFQDLSTAGYFGVSLHFTPAHPTCHPRAIAAGFCYFCMMT